MTPTRLAFIFVASLLGTAFTRADSVVYTQIFTVNQTITDGGELADFHTLDIGSGLITNVSVGLVIASASADNPAFSGDYYAALGHNDSDGYAVLLNRIGKTSNNASAPAAYGASHDGIDVTLSDSAPAGDIHAAAFDPDAPSTLVGTWAPDGRETDPATVLATDNRTATLSSFNGFSGNGEWRLLIADDSAGGVGRLVSWTLAITLSPDGVTPLKVASGATLNASMSATFTSNLNNQGVFIGPTGTDTPITITGSVSGAGSFQGNFVFTGAYSPGNSPAAVTFDGDLTLGATHVLTLEIGGITPGSAYDTITVNGQLTLGGTLNVVFVNGFIPEAGDVFTFFHATSIGGTFSQINLPAGFAALGDLAGNFSLTAIPEPATSATLTALAALLTLAYTALTRRRTK